MSLNKKTVDDINVKGKRVLYTKHHVQKYAFQPCIHLDKN